MKELTDEQYEAVYEASRKAWLNMGAEFLHRGPKAVAAGRAAYAASFPHAVAEALEEPSERELIATAIDAQTNWSFEPGCDYDRARRIFAYRLARLTAKPDAAVEAVTELLVGARKSGREFSATELVAAVDAARAKEPRS